MADNLLSPKDVIWTWPVRYGNIVLSHIGEGTSQMLATVGHQTDYEHFLYCFCLSSTMEIVFGWSGFEAMASILILFIYLLKVLFLKSHAA